MDNVDPFVEVYILDNVLKKNSSANLVEDLFAALQENDCLPAVNVDRTRSRHWVSEGKEKGSEY